MPEVGLIDMQLAEYAESAAVVVAVCVVMTVLFFLGRKIVRW